MQSGYSVFIIWERVRISVGWEEISLLSKQVHLYICCYTIYCPVLSHRVYFSKQRNMYAVIFKTDLLSVMYFECIFTSVWNADSYVFKFWLLQVLHFHPVIGFLWMKYLMQKANLNLMYWNSILSWKGASQKMWRCASLTRVLHCYGKKRQWST